MTDSATATTTTTTSPRHRPPTQQGLLSRSLSFLRVSTSGLGSASSSSSATDSSAEESTMSLPTGDPFPPFPQPPGQTSPTKGARKSPAPGSISSSSGNPSQAHAPRAMSLASKSRKRKGSLRKAILNRGALRERRESKSGLTIDIKQSLAHGLVPAAKVSTSPNALGPESPEKLSRYPGREGPSFGLGISGTNDAYTSRDQNELPETLEPRDGKGGVGLRLPPGSISAAQTQNVSSCGLLSPGIDSTTDEDDPPLQIRSRHGKSPLSFSSPSPPTDWDYSETEWWGWVVLLATWFVFVIGMGSCFGVWTWAWDVGKTPYAPPELEDDPTLPIVGYYPALIILSGVMAWSWVLVAWVGMKYFRHAKVTGE